MKAKDLYNKSIEELSHLLEESKSKMMELQFDNASGKLKNFSLIKKTKTDIARILTKIKELKMS